MIEPITIGDQTFIFDDTSGWIDKKTKKPASPQIVPILKLASEKAAVESEPEPEEKEQTTVQPEPERQSTDAPKKRRRRTKIDTSVEPVIIYGQKFVYDVNNGWIDAKTKEKAPDNLSNVLSFVSPPKKAPEEEYEETVKNKRREDKAIANVLGTTPEVMSSFGMAGQIASGKIDQLDERIQTLDAKRENKGEVNEALNRIIVKMIDHLASIDASLKEKFNVQKIKQTSLAAAQREQEIEGEQSDNERVDVTEEDLNKIEDQNKQEDASPVQKLAIAALAVGAVALMYKPIMNMVKDFSAYIGKVGETLNDTIEKINDAFEFVLNPFDSAGQGTEAAETEEAAPADPPTTPSNDLEPAPVEDINAPEGSSSSLLAPIAVGAAAVGMSALASRRSATPTGGTTTTVAAPVRPRPEVRPPAARGGMLSRMGQAVKSVAAPLSRTPLGKVAAVAAVTAAAGAVVGNYVMSDSPRSPEPDSSGSPNPPQPVTPEPTEDRPQDPSQEKDPVAMAEAIKTGQNGRLPLSSLTRITGGGMLQPAAAAAYEKMVAEARKDGITWTVTDSYRTYEEQVDLARRKGLYSEGGLAARPGTSNHGWGTALDLGGGANSRGTTQNNWLQTNAHRFGFQTIPREPWHWEYQGAGAVKGEESPFYSSMAGIAEAVQQLTAPAVETVVRGLREFIRTDTEYSDVKQRTTEEASKIARAARERQAMIVESKTTPPPTPPPPVAPPDKQNINPDKSGTVQTMPERDDKVVVTDYLQYFGVPLPKKEFIP